MEEGAIEMLWLQATNPDVSLFDLGGDRDAAELVAGCYDAHRPTLERLLAEAPAGVGRP